MLRILVADDHEIVRNAIRRLIEGRSDWQVCAEAEDGDEALNLAVAEQPDIAIVDISMPALNGVGLTKRLLEESPSTRVLLFTMHDDGDTVRKGFAAGARGFVLKTDDPRHLMAAISALGANQQYVSLSVAKLLLAEPMDRDERDGRRLTPRELEVAQLVCDGNTNPAIAYLLGLSIKTVETHRGAAMRKAGVHSPADFARFAIKSRLVGS